VPGSVLSALYGVLYNLQGRLGRLTLFIGLMAAINLALSILLIPMVGVAGAAIGTAVSYLISQWLYVQDQHVHLGVPLRAMASLFVVMAAFSLVQSLVLNLPGRLLLAVLFIAVVWTMARGLRMADPRILARMFGGRSAWMGGVLARAFRNDCA
jgi:O-antigen/teichoic acid export membrane protein